MPISTMFHLNGGHMESIENAADPFEEIGQVIAVGEVDVRKSEEVEWKSWKRLRYMM